MYVVIHMTRSFSFSGRQGNCAREKAARQCMGRSTEKGNHSHHGVRTGLDKYRNAATDHYLKMFRSKDEDAYLT